MICTQKKYERMKNFKKRHKWQFKFFVKLKIGQYSLLLFHKFCVVIQEWTFLVIPSIYVVSCIRKKYCAFYIVNFVCMRCKILQLFLKIMMKIIFKYTIFKNPLLLNIIDLCKKELQSLQSTMKFWLKKCWFK